MKLYTIGCPLCDILEEKIREEGLPIEIINDENDETLKKYDLFPVLVNDEGEEFVGGDALIYIEGVK